MKKRHFSELANLDFVSRLPAPAQASGSQCSQKQHGVPVGTTAEIDPHIRSSGVRVKVTDPGGFTEIPLAVDQARVWNKPVLLITDQDGQGIILEGPPDPELHIPVYPARPLALGPDLANEPGKMNCQRSSRVKEVFHYGL